MFTKKQVNSGYSEYCKAKQFLEMMNEALKKDNLTVEELPNWALDRYTQAVDLIKAAEKDGRNIDPELNNKALAD